MNYPHAFNWNYNTLVLLAIETIIFNIRNLIPFKKKNTSTNLTSDSNKKNINFHNRGVAVPSLKDTEFTWTDDQ